MKTSIINIRISDGNSIRKLFTRKLSSRKRNKKISLKTNATEIAINIHTTKAGTISSKQDKQIVSLLHWAKEYQIIYEDEYDIHQFREHIYSKTFHSEF